jgi:hypothetical protein
MDGVTAAMIVGIGLVCTLLVGVASQRRREHRTLSAPPRPNPPPVYGPTPDQQEDIDAVTRGIEQARSELLWLREQVAKERARLERLRRQTVAPPEPAETIAGSFPETPWLILGLKPGASAEDIRRRYRLLSRVWHPDRFVDGPPELRAEAEQMMARLNRAYQTVNASSAGARR